MSVITGTAERDDQYIRKLQQERDAALKREKKLRAAARQVRVSVYAHGLEGNDIVRISYDAYLRLIRALAKANQSEPTEGTPEDSHDD